MRIISLLSALLVILSVSFTYELSGNFLTIPSGSRASALGGAYIGLADDVDSIFYNPAGIGLMPSTQLMVMHAQWFQSIKYENAGFAFPLKNIGNFGIGLRALIVGGIEVRDEPSDEPKETISTNHLDIIGGYSRMLTENISVGGNFHYIYQKIYEESATSVCADAGFLYTTDSRFFSIGAVVRNLGTKVRFIDEAYSLPLTFGGGVAFRLMDGRIVVASDVDYQKEGGATLRNGFETTIASVISPRVGINYNLNEKKFKYALGVGFAFSGFGFDYTFTPFGDLGQTHRFTLCYSFGRAREHIEREIEKQTYKELSEKEMMMANSLYQTGMNHYKEGRYEEAITTLDLALVWNPELEEAQVMIERAMEEKRANEIETHLRKAENYYSFGRISEAILESKLVLEVDPANSEALEMLRKAEAELERRQSKREEKIKELFDEALSHYSRGDYKKAIELWEKVLDLDPDNIDATNSIQDARWRLSDKSSELIRKAKKYEEAGNWLMALASWREVLDLDPSNKEAQEGESRALTSISENKNRLLSAGKDLYTSGNYEEAERIFYQVLEISPDNSEAKYYLEMIVKKREEEAREEAVDYYAIYLAGINAYTDHRYRTAIEYWKQIPPDSELYVKAQSNITRAQNILKKLD